MVFVRMVCTVMLAKHSFSIFCIIITVLLFFLVLFFKQSAFIQKYDSIYWKDRFEHSQWTLPLSRRDMGDDGIYAYGGYRLMHGASIEETNTNKPPVGIYLIGFSIAASQNPNYFALLVGVASAVAFYFILKLFVKSREAVLFGIALLVINPMFFNHTFVPLIDLVQTLFLLLNVLFFIYIFRSKKYTYLFAALAGLSLGFFTETKPPIQLPFILLFEIGYLLYKRKLLEIAFFGVCFTIGILIPYFRYFQTGHSLIDYVKLHKYMASVYYEGKNEVHRTALFQAIFLGRFPDIASGVMTKFSDWWIGLTVLFIGGLYAIIFYFKKFDIFLKGLGIFCILTFVLYSNVSSYPRYLLTILPFIILFFVLLLERLKPNMRHVVFVIFLVLGLINAFVTLRPSPDENLQRFYYNFENQLFQDTYEENIANKETLSLNREIFRRQNLKALHDANIRYAVFEEKDKVLSQREGKGSVRVKVTYFTQDLGTFTEEKVIQLKKVREEWKVVWDWGLLLTGYKPGYTFAQDVTYGNRGTIYDQNQNIIAEDSIGYLLSLDPEKIDKSRENQMLTDIAKITGIGEVAIHNAYTENPLPGAVVPIATLFVNIGNKELAILHSYPGIILTEYSTRIYSGLQPPLKVKKNLFDIKNTKYPECCTQLYSSFNYHGIQGVEKEHDTVLSGFSGGRLVMIDKNGKVVRTLIQKNPKDGRDVVITQ